MSKKICEWGTCIYGEMVGETAEQLIAVSYPGQISGRYVSWAPRTELLCCPGCAAVATAEVERIEDEIRRDSGEDGSVS